MRAVNKDEAGNLLRIKMSIHADVERSEGVSDQYVGRLLSCLFQKRVQLLRDGAGNLGVGAAIAPTVSAAVPRTHPRKARYFGLDKIPVEV